ncbi:hypothetical protein Vretifemale_6190 [Volvox reticuliferus]|uniref:Right handed beta helix domain-containing protein n=1 Tax=Volvox reticuliferus TaxID=1737510 RepID=A0A8J4C6F3_9CHLO|nr:hypothetical protein Vretifemale_6190 [Volvox reticuliferus]
MPALHPAVSRWFVICASQQPCFSHVSRICPLHRVHIALLHPTNRCCFVGFEFHTTVVHNEVSICCFGPNSPLARFEHCTFSGLTGLRVPYSKGSQTRLELYDCTLLGTTQSLAAVQMDAGKLLMNRCGIQNNSVGVEVGPEALARLADCELRWCGTALVVDGCLAMANCRLWGNGKLGNLNTDARLRAAQSYSEACLAAGGPPPLPPWANKQQEEQLPEQAQEGLQPPSALPSCNRSRRRGPRGGGGPLGDAGAGTSTAAAVASTSDGALTSLAPAIVQSIHQQIQDGNAGGSGSGGGASSISPNRVATLAAAQWAEVSAAFASRQQLVRVVGCEVTAPQLIMRTGLHKEVRKKARELVRQVYGAPDDDLFPEWEVLVHSDLDSDMDEEDSSVTSGSVMADDEDLEDEDEDPLDLADDPDLDESGESQSGSDSDSSSGSGSGDAADEMDRGAAVADGEAGEAEGEDEEWGAGESLSSGRGSSDSSSDSDSRESDSDTSDSSGSGDSDTSDSSGSGDSDSGNGNEHDSSSGNTDDAGGSSVRPH